MAEGLARLAANIRISANVPPPAENFRSMEQGLSNIFVLETRPPIGNNRTLVFRYDVEIKEIERNRSLTKPTGDDGKRELLREICFQLVSLIHRSTNGFNSNGEAQFVYDNRKILYTNVRVDPIEREITPEQMNEYCRHFLNNARLTFEMQPCSEEAAHEFDLNDLGPGLQRIGSEQANRSLRTFLEMLTSQPFINDGTHTTIGYGRLFEKREYKRLNDAVCAIRGIAKGVRIIANGNVKPCLAMVTDVKTCAFFVADNLENIANAMINAKRTRGRLNPNDPNRMEDFWSDFGNVYRGVSAYLTYNPARVVVIDSITKRKCGDINFNIDGRNISMVEFYRGKNVNINPNMPAVRQNVDRDSFYPLNCLMILPYQRISMDRMSVNDDMAQISSILLKENATPPEVRYAAIKTEMGKLAADGNGAKFMRQFYVRLIGRNDVQLGMLNMPKIRFGHAEQSPDNLGRFEVRQFKYLQPSKVLNSWVVGYPSGLNYDKIKEFISSLKRTGENAGMKIPQPVFEFIELIELEEKMRQFTQRNVNFFMYIDNKCIKSHSTLKLLEFRINLLTQHLTMELIERSGISSVKNVLNKMNMKLFGQNYMPIFNPVCRNKFDLSSGKVLVIGIDTSIPPRATAFEQFQLRNVGIQGLKSEEPMVIGLCANFLQNPTRFGGDYYFQPFCQDVLNGEFLIRKLLWIFNEMKNQKRTEPSTIFIIRDGASEGMIPNLFHVEFDVFAEACNRFKLGWKPNFVYCIVDKRHNKRFFKQAQNGEAVNTLPGTVIDRKFVRVDMHEFFLQSHTPLNGVSKIPQYIFPVNQVGADNNELEAFLHGLCNMWQIVNLPPALPTPVLQAKELAKRGRNNYVEFKRKKAAFIPYQPQQGNQRIRMVDCVRLNEMFSFGNSFLVKTRFNA